MAMRILIAPSGFKESLEPYQVADYIAAGILRALPDAKILKAPLVDGGEGFTKALVAATRGTLHNVTVTGPVGRPVEAYFGFLGCPGPRTAVVEMASAAGLRLVPRDARDPLKTTTYGVGELIKAALDAGAQKLLIGCGDSGTNDGGAGMAQALGVRLLDAFGKEIGPGGGELLRLERTDMSDRDRRIERVQIDVACNWHNMLCGPNGVARVFGPQKGASPDIVERLAAAMDHYAAVIERDVGIDVRTMPGAGASGGLGAGLHSFLNATLHPRYDIVMQYLEIDSLLRKVDLVITAEGCLDSQTPLGKIPAEVVRRAKPYHLPVIALAGTIGQGAHENLVYGIDSFSCILEAPVTLSEAIEKAPDLLIRAAERVMRAIRVGQKLSRSEIVGHATMPIQHSTLYGNIKSQMVEPPQANSAHPEFLTMMSRELRTPLNLVLSYAGMIKDQILGQINSEQLKALDLVLRYSLDIRSMINNISPTTQNTDVWSAVIADKRQTHSARLSPQIERNKSQTLRKTLQRAIQVAQKRKSQRNPPN